MIISKYSDIDGKMYVEASDYDKILYELKNTKDENDRTVELPFDPLETANMLINAKYKDKIPLLEREVDRNIYDTNDLEQIAEHLLVYCKHNQED